MSNLVLHEINNYIRTRIATSRIALLWFVVTIACLAASPVTPVFLIYTPAFVALLITSFRLWDDLADLPHDRKWHTDRVLSGCTNITPFYLILVLSLGLTLAAFIALLGTFRTIGYVILAGGIAVLYGIHKLYPRMERRIRESLILLKYPGFVALFSETPASWRTAATAVILYAALVVHAWLEKESS